MSKWTTDVIPDEMIERVARAIYLTTPWVGSAPGVPVRVLSWEEIGKTVRPQFYAQAENAIKEMREPTVKMLKASSRGDSNRALHYWRRMIDACQPETRK